MTVRSASTTAVKQPAVSGNSETPGASRSQRLGKHSIFVVSTMVFIAVNFFFSFAEPFTFDPYRFHFHGWSWWTLNDLRQDSALHNVALLGSSLMVSAVASADANYLKKPLDLTVYHKASYLDKNLSTAFGGKFDTFNLAAPGQMPSDAYLLLQAMVNTSQRPEVVIYGLAPRDFVDSTLGSPTDTESFHYLKRLVNTDEIASGLYRSPVPRLDWFLQRTLFLYGSSLDLQMIMGDEAKRWIDRIVTRPYSSTSFTNWDRRKILPNYMANEVFPGSMLALPVTREEADRQFDDDTQNYKDRYKHPEPSVFKTQFYFLRKLTAYCKREKIDLILVNMPLTQINLDILKPVNHANYLKAMQAFAFSQNLSEIDMCDLNLFNLKDFHDSVHLNAFGGKKFFDHLVSQLQTMPVAGGALRMAGQELSRHAEAVAAGKGGIK